MGLTNLGACQGEMGRTKQALESTQEALSHYRKLVQEHPNVFLREMLVSLNNLRAP